MIRLFAAVSFAAILIAAPALAAERSFPVGGFTKLSLAGSPDVMVMTGKQPGVRASGSDAALERLDIRVEGNTLKIDTKRGSGWSWVDHSGVKVAVTVPMLSAIDVSGSGGVVVDRIKTADFAAAMSGSGSIRVAALDADASSFSTAGSGSMEAVGRCKTGAAKIAGSGDLKLAGLKCETLSASVAGSGTIDAFASRTATLAIMGSGDINLTGGGRCTVSSAGSGKAHCS